MQKYSRPWTAPWPQFCPVHPLPLPQHLISSQCQSCCTAFPSSSTLSNRISNLLGKESGLCDALDQALRRGIWWSCSDGRPQVSLLSVCECSASSMCYWLDLSRADWSGPFIDEKEFRIHMKRSLHRPQSVSFLVLIYPLLSMFLNVWLTGFGLSWKHKGNATLSRNERDLHEPALIFWSQTAKEEYVAYIKYLQWFTSLRKAVFFSISFTQWEISPLQL